MKRIAATAAVEADEVEISLNQSDVGSIEYKYVCSYIHITFRLVYT